MEGATGQSIRVLVVDDETSVCRVITRALVREGIEADGVSSSEEMQERLSAETYHVVLLDRSMDESEEGSSLVSKIRRHGEKAKVVYFTGDFVDEEARSKVDGVVQKPINGKQLAIVLRDLLS